MTNANFEFLLAEFLKVSSKIDDGFGEARQFRAETNARFEKMETRFEKMETRLDRLEAKVDLIASDVKDIKGQTAATVIDVLNLKKRVSALEGPQA